MPFRIIRDDIAHVRADAIVNSANPQPGMAGAAAEAGRFGIDAGSAVNFRADAEGVRTNFEAMSMAVTAARSCGSRGTAWRERIERTFRKEQ